MPAAGLAEAHPRRRARASQRDGQRAAGRWRRAPGLNWCEAEVARPKDQGGASGLHDRRTASSWHPFERHDDDRIRSRRRRAEDQPRQLLRGFPPRPGDPARHAAHHHGRRRGALHGALRPALRRAVVRRVRAGRSAIRARPSTTCSSSTSCSARPCRTSRSTPSPTSATPRAASSRPSIPGDTLSAALRGDRPEARTPTARPASSTCAPPAATSRARRCSSTCAG